MKILIVDDERLIVDIYCRWTRDLGHEVYAASCGFDAIKIFENGEKFDVVIVDWRLPDISGIDLGWYMLRMEEKMPIVKICISGGEVIRQRWKADRAGYDFFIMKPIDYSYFRSTLEKAEKLVKDRNETESYKRDPMTGLWTKKEMTLRLQKLNDYDRISGAMIIDGDDFGKINKSYDEIVGDLVLICAAGRVQNVVSGSLDGIIKDVGRWGEKADTVLVLFAPGDVEVLEDTGNTLLDMFRKDRIHIRDKKFGIPDLLIPYTMSIGAALTGCGMPPEFAVRAANAAMKFVKNNGKNGFALFDPEKHPLILA